MGKKILSTVLVVVLAFLAGFGGGMLANQEAGNESTTISAFGQTVQIKKSEDKTSNSGQNSSVYSGGNITIDVSDDITIAEAIAEKVMPSVVGVSTTYQTTSSYSSMFDMFDMFGYGFGGGGNGNQRVYENSCVGTGVIVDTKGYILTNSHVINDGDFTKIVISLYDGREIEAELLWNDATLDLAVVKINADNLVAAELGDSDSIKVGAYAAAIGNPLGLEFERSMSQGIISGLNRTITVSSSSSSSSGTIMEGLMQTDATINSGNSGGPLLNSKGQVIGINSARAADGEGMGFAIPINTAKPIVEQIMETGKFDRAYIGISGIGLSSQSYTSAQLIEEFGVDDGIYIASISENGGAKAAGLQKGDIITKVDGVSVGTMNKINTILVKYKIGDKVKVEYYRDKVSHTAEITLSGM